MAISFNCSKCDILIKFPETPNWEKCRWERICHIVYTENANFKKLCWECEK